MVNINPNKKNPKQEKIKKKKKRNEKTKKKEKEKGKLRTKKLILRDHQQWKIPFITLNNNGFCLLSIYPPSPSPRPLTPHLANQLMDNVI